MQGQLEKARCHHWRTDQFSRLLVRIFLMRLDNSAFMECLCMCVCATHHAMQEEAENPKQTRGDIMQEDTCDPIMSCFSHFNTFPTVRETEMTFPDTSLFFSVLMLTTRCKNSVSPSLPRKVILVSLTVEKVHIKTAGMTDLPPVA